MVLRAQRCGHQFFVFFVVAVCTVSLGLLFDGRLVPQESRKFTARPQAAGRASLHPAEHQTTEMEKADHTSVQSGVNSMSPGGLSAELAALKQTEPDSSHSLVAFSIALLANALSTEANTALSARIAARGCHNRHQAHAPPSPAAFMLGAPKSGTTDVYFRTRNMPWAVRDATKESQWFDFACFQTVYEFSAGRPPVSPTGQVGCPPRQKPPKAWGRSPNFQTNADDAQFGPVEAQTAGAGAIQQGIFPRLKGGNEYLHNCTAWHYQKFFVSGTYDCITQHQDTLMRPIMFPSPGLWRGMGAEQAGEGLREGGVQTAEMPPAVADNQHTKVEDMRGHPLWLTASDGLTHPIFEGWKLNLDWTARTLAMEDGAAMAAHVSPLTRFVYMHRHPVDRMWSQFQHLRTSIAGEAHAPISPDLFHERVKKETTVWHAARKTMLAGVRQFLRSLQGAMHEVHQTAARALVRAFEGTCHRDCPSLQIRGAARCQQLARSGCRGTLQAHWSISSHLLEAALLAAPSAWSRAIHMPPLVPDAWRESFGSRAENAFAAALMTSQGDVQWLRARADLLQAYVLVDVNWRKLSREMERNAAKEERWFDDWKLIMRSLFAPQHIRLFGVMPISDTLSIQSEEYYRDPRSVLSMLQAWLCVPLSEPPCQSKHPFVESMKHTKLSFKNSVPKSVPLPVQARPSHRYGEVAQKTTQLINAALLGFMQQHTELLDLLKGVSAAQVATNCIRHIQTQCNVQWEGVPGWHSFPRSAQEALDRFQSPTSVPWAQVLPCVHRVLNASCPLLVGPLALHAGLQFRRSTADSGSGTLRQLMHRFQLSKWNTSLEEPGAWADSKSTLVRGQVDYINTAAGFDLAGQVPQGSSGRLPYSQQDVHSATSWSSCVGE